MACVNLDTIRLRAIREGCRSLCGWSGCPYGRSNWIKKESNFSNSTLNPLYSTSLAMAYEKGLALSAWSLPLYYP